MFALETPSQLLESVAPTLGFEPRDSLVLVLVDGGALAAVLRVDLGDAADGVTVLADTAVRSGADGGVVAIVVAGDGAWCPDCLDDHRHLVDVLATELGRRGVRLLAAHVADKLTAGGRWFSIDGTGAAGVLDDPAVSPIGAAAVAEGRRVYDSRADLVSVVTADSARAAALAPALSSAVVLVEDIAAAANQVVAEARRMANGAIMTDPELVAIGAVLVDKGVRDMLFTSSASAAAAAAEDLWRLLARVLPGRWRTEALTLLAFSAYVRGDGPLAGIALEEALQLDADHVMAGQLRTALLAGFKPDDIRRVLTNVPPVAA